MRSTLIGVLIGILTLTSQVFGLEATGAIKKVDADTGVIVVFSNGADRTLRAAPEAQFFDAAGKPLADGIRAKELKEGAEVSITVEREGNILSMKALRLGARPAPPPPGRPTTGLKPLVDMTAEDRYKSEDGGLYGGGRNAPPPALLALARVESAKIAPLDADGKPAKDGRIALVSISMSNATQEFSVFKRVADADPDKSPLLTIVDCAQGGQAMAQWVDPKGRAWTEADRRLVAANVSPQQVQIAWVKLANIAPAGDLPEHGRKLYRDTLTVLQNASARFPNLRIAYLGSRIYGGWSSGRLNPEPYAYEGAFPVRWLIQDQGKGETELNFDPARGAVKAPLLLWGPYLWADGLNPRKSDGLVWERADVADDGVHPTASGRQKVADMLLKFFKNDPLAKTWFVRPARAN